MLTGSRGLDSARVDYSRSQLIGRAHRHSSLLLIWQSVLQWHNTTALVQKSISTIAVFFKLRLFFPPLLVQEVFSDKLWVSSLWRKQHFRAQTRNQSVVWQKIKSFINQNCLKHIWFQGLESEDLLRFFLTNWICSGFHNFLSFLEPNNYKENNQITWIDNEIITCSPNKNRTLKHLHLFLISGALSNRRLQSEVPTFKTCHVLRPSPSSLLSPSPSVSSIVELC